MRSAPPQFFLFWVKLWVKSLGTAPVAASSRSRISAVGYMLRDTPGNGTIHGVIKEWGPVLKHRQKAAQTSVVEEFDSCEEHYQ